MVLSCEEPYIPPTTEEDQQYVIEGYIEEGEGALATYVMVTKKFALSVNHWTGTTG